jgi:hypothetical protein
MTLTKKQLKIIQECNYGCGENAPLGYQYIKQHHTKGKISPFKGQNIRMKQN